MREPEPLREKNQQGPITETRQRVPLPHPARSTLSRALAYRRGLSEASFRRLLWISGLAILVLLLAIFLSLLVGALPAIKDLGVSFLTGTVWNPVSSTFGALPFLAGTLLTSFLALFISAFFSLAISIFLGEYARTGAVPSFIRSVIELLAGIPSVIYGFWGLFFLVPLVRYMEMKLGIPPIGVGIFTASLILSVMIIPYSASLGREVIALVPSELKEAAASLGATRFEIIRKIVLPYARSGIFAGLLLALGRALGETMAVTMVIGNSNMLPTSLFAPGNTMASIIANEFSEATGKVYLSSLVEIALLLFVVTAVINIVGRIVIDRMAVGR
jgi:phosphate transport system permease protein